MTPFSNKQFKKLNLATLSFDLRQLTQAGSVDGISFRK